MKKIAIHKYCGHFLPIPKYPEMNLPVICSSCGIRIMSLGDIRIRPGWLYYLKIFGRKFQKRKPFLQSI
ncbi:MAG: cysteine-rich KTR protein [Podoviridae sp. ctviO18]|nr:MAG: cysteine-rich KTR protein [Podoviridae sp. ctviO18]